MIEQQKFASLLGEAAIVVWGDMPRDIQEALFETAMRDRSELRHDLARLLHERHPERSIRPSPPDQARLTQTLYSGNATSAITGRWSEYARALRSVQAERIVRSREA